MPRPRKYEYGINRPETIFVQVPEKLKEDYEALFDRRERNEMIQQFIIESIVKKTRGS